MDRRVIVRAHGGQPLCRMICDLDRKAAYLAHPDMLAAVKCGDSRPVGFPLEDVFAYDAGLFTQLSRQWQGRQLTSPDLWALAMPYRESGAVLDSAHV